MPNRILKESIITSRSVNALTDFQFRLWIHLIATADDFGRLPANPKTIRNLCFPCRDGITVKQIVDSISQLARTGIIRQEGESFLYLTDQVTMGIIRNACGSSPWLPVQKGNQQEQLVWPITPEPADAGKAPNSICIPVDSSETPKNDSAQQACFVHPKNKPGETPQEQPQEMSNTPQKKSQEEKEEIAPFDPPFPSPPTPPVFYPPYNPPKGEREESCTPGAQAHVKGARWDYPDDFEQFWAQYPKKTGKGAAYAAWCKQRFTDQQRQLVMVSLALHKASYDWTKDGGQYIPNPATWLNQARFQDEPRMQAPQKDDKPSFNPFYDYVKAHEGGDPF